MDVEPHPDNGNRAVVTFENPREHDDFCNRTQWWIRLSWRQYMLGPSRNPLDILIDATLKGVSGGEPEAYPHQETVRVATLSHVAGKLLLAQARSQDSRRQAQRQQVLEPILGYFAGRTG